MEMLITVVVISIIASVSIPNFTGLRSAAQSAKLQNDIDRINQAIDMYRASGGNLAGLSKPQDILDRLKTERQRDTASQFVGLTGSTIDRRLAARITAGGNDGQPRAVWDQAGSRFIVSKRGAGVTEFYLDDALAEVDYGEEIRSTSPLGYNGDPGWVWAYRDRPLPQAPVVGSPGPVVAEVPESPFPTALDAPRELREPVILPGDGTFKPSEFPETVTLSNPNDDSTWLMVSVGGGPFVKYSAPLSLTGNTTVVAFAAGNPSRWISSKLASAAFWKSDPVRLLPPSIRLSAPEFNEDTPTISVSLANPNATGLSQIHYAVVAPGATVPPRSGWAAYGGGSFSVDSNSYPSGFSVQAYARALDAVDYQDSADSTATAGANFIFEDPGITDVLYIIDVSGSMATKVGSSTRIDLVIEALSSAINRLNSSTRFSVATFGGDIEWTDPTLELMTASDASKQAMNDRVSTFKADSSGTNYEAALRIPFLYGRKPAIVYFLTDGQPTSGGDYTDEIDTLAAQGIQVNTIGVDLNQESNDRLAAIASKTKGKSKVVQTK